MMALVSVRKYLFLFWLLITLLALSIELLSIPRSAGEGFFAFPTLAGLLQFAVYLLGPLVLGLIAASLSRSFRFGGQVTLAIIASCIVVQLLGWLIAIAFTYPGIRDAQRIASLPSPTVQISAREIGIGDADAESKFEFSLSVNLERFPKRSLLVLCESGAPTFIAIVERCRGGTHCSFGKQAILSPPYSPALSCRLEHDGYSSIQSDTPELLRSLFSWLPYPLRLDQSYGEIVRRELEVSESAYSFLSTEERESQRRERGANQLMQQQLAIQVDHFSLRAAPAGKSGFLELMIESEVAAVWDLKVEQLPFLGRQRIAVSAGRQIVSLAIAPSDWQSIQGKFPQSIDILFLAPAGGWGVARFANRIER